MSMSLLRRYYFVARISNNKNKSSEVWRKDSARDGGTVPARLYLQIAGMQQESCFN